VGSGLRRIEAVTGRGTENYFEKLTQDWQEIGKSLGAGQDGVKEKVIETISAYEAEKKQRLNVEKELARKIVESLVPEEINGVKVISVQVPALPSQVLRDMSDMLREKLKSGIIVLGTVAEDKPSFLAVVTQDLAAKGFNAGNIVREVAKVTGGSGGGKPTMAQAGGKDKTKIDEALQLVKKLVAQQGK
jgi:alanyl-tRNA synthetase